CFLGLKATVEERFKRKDLRGMKIAMQGLGQVGMRLCEMLHREGASVIAADVAPDRVAEAEKNFRIKCVSDDEVMASDCAVLAPCALGGTLNDQTIPKLRCGAVAGCANNQLLEPRHGDELTRRGILYAPDFVINAGGIINVGLELAPGGYDPETAHHKI